MNGEECECFDVQGSKVEVCGLNSCFFISFKQIVSILIDFSCGKENGFDEIFFVALNSLFQQ